VVNTYFSVLSGTLIEKHLLSCPTAIGFEDHHVETQMFGFLEYNHYQLPSDRLKEINVIYSLDRVEAIITFDNVCVEVSH
jgi:hypothetical protein